MKLITQTAINIMFLDPELLEKSFLLAKNSLQTRGLPAYIKTRWLNALEKAKDRLLEEPYFAWQPEQLTIVSIPNVKNRKKDEKHGCRFYQANLEKCCRVDMTGFCQAFYEGFPCWHRAAFWLLGIYFDQQGKIGTNNSPTRAISTPTVNFG